MRHVTVIGDFEHFHSLTDAQLADAAVPRDLAAVPMLEWVLL
jgi:hypothetical protein